MTKWNRTELSRYGERWEVVVTPEKDVTIVKKKGSGTVYLRWVDVEAKRGQRGSVRVTVEGLTLLRERDFRGVCRFAHGVDGFPWEGGNLVIEARPQGAIERVEIVGDVDSERGEG